MTDDEPRGGTLLSFSTPLAARITTPPTAAQTTVDHAESVDPRDPASLLTFLIDVLVRLGAYGKKTNELATRLLEISGRAGLVVSNAAELRQLATIAAKDAADVDAFRRDLEPWLDHLRGQDRSSAAGSVADRSRSRRQAEGRDGE